MIFMCNIDNNRVQSFTAFCSLFCLIFHLEEHWVHRYVEIKLNGGNLGWIGVGCLRYFIILHEKQSKSTCHALSVAYISVGSLSSNLAALTTYFATLLWVLRPRQTLLITHHHAYAFITSNKTFYKMKYNVGMAKKVKEQGRDEIKQVWI